MLKFLFEFITNPLGLPIEWYWEYIILGLINIIAFGIAWKLSPGGRWGSEIHWGIRTIAFGVLWGITYIVIAFIKFVISHLILVLILLGTLVFITGMILLFYRLWTRKQQNSGTW